MFRQACPSTPSTRSAAEAVSSVVSSRYVSSFVFPYRQAISPLTRRLCYVAKKQRHADLAVRSCVRGNFDRSASTSPIIRDPLCGNVIPRRKISRGDIGNDACRRKYDITSIRSNNVREFNIRHIARHGSCPIQRPTMPRIVIAKYYRHRQTYWVFWGQIPIAQRSLYLENIV